MSLLLSRLVLVSIVLICLISESVEQNAPSLSQICGSREMRNRIKSDCENGRISNCEKDTDPDTHICQASYTCRDVNHVTSNTTMKCLILCGLLRFGVRRPVSDYWIDELTYPTSLTLERKFTGQAQHETRAIYVDDDVEENTYAYFNQLEQMSWVRVTTSVASCPLQAEQTEYAGYNICTTDSMLNSRLMRSHCYAAVMPFCQLQRTFARGDYCSRSFQCSGIPFRYGQIDTRRCGVMCWLFEKTFHDFPDMRIPENETKFDVIVDVTLATGSQHRTRLIDVTSEAARRIFYSYTHLAFMRYRSFDFSISATSRDCYVEQPSPCQSRLYGETRGYPELPFCSFPRRFQRPVEDSFTTSPNNFSPECAVRVECNLGTYYQRNRWTRSRWCFYMDWIFDKSVRWLGIEATSNITTYMTIYIKDNQSGDRGVTTNRVDSLRSIARMFDRFTAVNGYTGDIFAVHAVFNNCLAETNGRAEISVQGDDPCRRTNFQRSTPLTVGGCTSDPFDYVTRGPFNKTSTCTFYDGDQLSTRCSKIHWMVFPLYFSGGSVMRFTLHLRMFATDVNGLNYTRELSPVKRGVMMPYIKNFLSEIHVANLSALTFETRREESWY